MISPLFWPWHGRLAPLGLFLQLRGFGFGVRDFLLHGFDLRSALRLGRQCHEEMLWIRCVYQNLYHFVTLLTYKSYVYLYVCMYVCMYIYIHIIYIYITWLMMYFGSYMLQDKKLRLGSAAQRIQMALVIFSLSSSTFRSSHGHGHHMAHVVSCVLQKCQQLPLCPLVCRHPGRMMMVMMVGRSPLSPRYLKRREGTTGALDSKLHAGRGSNFFSTCWNRWMKNISTLTILSTFNIQQQHQED